jgi:anthranilate synthase component 1
MERGGPCCAENRGLSAVFFVSGKFGILEERMLLPEYTEFRDLARRYKRVVVYRELAGDMLTPVLLLQRFALHRHLFLLESANLDRSFSRFTFFGINPEQVLTVRNDQFQVENSDGSVMDLDENPIDFLTGALSGEDSYSHPELGSFSGGYVGFMGYDMVNFMDVLRKPIRQESESLSMAYLKVNEFYVFDNHLKKLYAAVSVQTNAIPTTSGSDNGAIPTTPGLRPAASGRTLEELYAGTRDRTLEMANEIMMSSGKPAYSGTMQGQMVDFRQDEFMEAVTGLRGEIERGECIQTVLSNRYEVQGEINSINLYRTIRNINPSPYMFYLKFGDEVLLGTSPEIHLKITEGEAVLKPIAGTYRTNGKGIEKVKEELLSDSKEVAEHLMLLDLARNDLYTGCDPESVRVTESFKAEVYSHVVHIVSEVRGNLMESVPPLKLFCNTFPAGTVSGAPKVRAMELIDQYEKTPRGFYAGCAGYFSYSGDIDTCIIIRSALARPGSVILRAGAGIVYDSVPEKEYREVENKLGALFDALKQIPLLESRNVFNDR